MGKIADINTERIEEFGIATGQLFEKRVLRVVYKVIEIGSLITDSKETERANFIVADCFNGLGLHGSMLWIGATDFSHVLDMYTITYLKGDEAVARFKSGDVASANRVLVGISKLQDWTLDRVHISFNLVIKNAICTLVKLHTGNEAYYPKRGN